MVIELFYYETGVFRFYKLESEHTSLVRQPTPMLEYCTCHVVS